MDTSKEYFEMCREATVIQEAWIIQKGDHFVIALSGVNGIIENPSTIVDQNLFVWLPKQDQLQNIGNKNATLLCQFANWVNDNWGLNGKVRRSYEQLWLLYYMDKIHDMEWDSENKKWY